MSDATVVVSPITIESTALDLSITPNPYIKLGPVGAMATLPAVCWQQGAAPVINYDVTKGVNEVKMLDGSSRFDITEHGSASWTLDWDGLGALDLATLTNVVALNEELVFVNGFTDNIAHNVVVTGYSHGLKAETASRTKKYVFSMTLRQVD